MAQQSANTQVPVDLLRPGLYVIELDRPWVETPFLFQGFRIADEQDLETLRKYCRSVVIDPERCETGALEALQRAVPPGGKRAHGRARSTANLRMPSQRDRRKAAGALFRDRVHPDRDRFRVLVQAAWACRREARRAVDAAIGQVRMGRLVDTAGTREVVEGVVDVLLEDTSAALWLTNLKNRHEYTAIHSVNVCVLSLALGVHLGLERAGLVRLGFGALLHDVGKMRTPADILNKPDPLTDEEHEIVKRHAQDGYEIVSESGEVAFDSLEIIRLHHERMGGQGYPVGLKGDRIPRHVRIAGLSDTYDAMTSDRVYRQGMAPDKALHGMYRDAPTTFGVDLVQEFIRCLGIFPVGSLVQLDNDAVGIVVGTRPGGGLWPTVLMLRAPGGEPYEKRLLVNLEAAARDEGARRHIRRAVEPAEVDADVPGLVANEFGLVAA